MSISKDNTRIMVTVSKDLKNQLQELAKNENRSLNNYISTILLQHLQNHKNG